MKLNWGIRETRVSHFYLYMADQIKNPFDFGTGSIDKDQWQRDIDSEQDAFITRYTNATNKKSGLLLR